jgi:prefoldin subunit 5
MIELENKRLTDYASRIETLLDKLADLESEKDMLKKELAQKMNEYSTALETVEYWESTGLEAAIDELQNKIFGLDNSISYFEQKLEDV